jgi:hypothetical protein
LEKNTVNELLDGCLIEPPRFQPMARFHKFGAQRVFYKGSAPQQKETEQEKALAQVASEQWARYKEVGIPARDAFFKRVEESGTEPANSFARGTAASATTANYGTLGTSAPAKSGFTLAMARAKDGAENTQGASLSQEDMHVGGLQDIVSMGQGDPTQARAGLSDLAQRAASKAGNDAAIQYNDRAAKAAAAGTLTGAAGQLYMGSKSKLPGAGVSGDPEKYRGYV